MIHDLSIFVKGLIVRSHVNLFFLIHENNQKAFSMTSKSLKRQRKREQAKAEEKAASAVAAAEGPNKKKKDFTHAVSEALNNERWEESLSLLKEMRDAGVVPKLGSIQRWVRIADLSGHESTSAALLDAVMRAATGASGGTGGAGASSSSSAHSGPSHGPKAKSQGSITRHPPWAPSVTSAQDTNKNDEVDAAAKEAAERCKGRFRVISAEGQGVPHSSTAPSPIFLVEPSVLELEDKPSKLISRVPVPFVKDAVVLTNVLSRVECAQIVAVAESLGFQSDVDYSFIGSLDSSKSASRTSAGGERAQGLVWLIDKSIDQVLFDRVSPHLPQKLGGGKLAGINMRWRLYRYDEGSVYRPHVDGAWPGSGLRSDGQKCVFDAFGDRWSKLTFLIYLNEDFEGGSTVFYTPASTSEGVLEARGVAPRVGNVLVFPHAVTVSQSRA